MSTYTTTVTATEASEVVVFPRHPLTEIIWSNRELRSLMLASFSDRFSLKARHCDAPQSDDAVLHSHVGPALGATLEQQQRHHGDHKHSTRNSIGWLLTLLLPCLFYYQFSINTTDLDTGQATLMVAILVAIVTMWIFRLMPDFVPALVGITGVVLLGLAPPDVALSGFASDSFFLAMGIFGLSAVLTHSGFSYRILLWLLRIGPANKLWYNFSLFATGLALTPLVPTANGRTAIVTPFLNDLLNSVDHASASREGPRLGVSMLGGVSLMSAMFLSSKSINFVVFGFLPMQEQSLYNWFYWLIAASVCGLVLLATFLLINSLLFRNASQPYIPRETVRHQAQLLGPVRPDEWAGALGLGVLLLGFLTVSIHRIPIPWISLGIISVLLMNGYLGRSDFQRRIDWGFLAFLGALIGLIASMQYLHLDVWLTQQLAWLATFMKQDFNLFIVLLASAIFLVRLALPINATVVIFATLLIPTAVNVGINPWLIGFLVLLFSESYIWPYQASYYLQYRGIVNKVALTDERRTALFNAIMAAAKIGAVYASLPYWRNLGVL